MKISFSNTELKTNLIKVLNSNLPGIEAQRKLAPSIRNPHNELPEQNDKTKHSAVSILIFPKNNELYIVFIKRATYNGKHSGQIAFPGGKFEIEDKTLKQTAIRETFEEIGVLLKEENILGELTPLFIPISNILVQAYVAFLDFHPNYKLNQTEVDCTIEVKLNDLLNENLFAHKTLNEHNLQIEVPYFDAQGNHVWGATAMILSEFIEVLKSTLNLNINFY